MRLGLALWPDRDVRELAGLAVAAENAGFDGLITHGLAAPYIRMVAKQVDRGVLRAGRSVDDCDVALMLEIALCPDVGRGRGTLRPRCLYMVGGEYAEEGLT